MRQHLTADPGNPISPLFPGLPASPWVSENICKLQTQYTKMGLTYKQFLLVAALNTKSKICSVKLSNYEPYHLAMMFKILSSAGNTKLNGINMSQR